MLDGGPVFYLATAALALAALSFCRKYWDNPAAARSYSSPSTTNSDIFNGYLIPKGILVYTNTWKACSTSTKFLKVTEPIGR
ncbi:hypothetical protein DEU56DRAFT_127345 [Suillus clintonianus]|uniref:uncharacterized protein n=1 Tax=Suillus clintonianus TaxID=1904413 RepID=UPI001B873A81|nr:uncharacterized protein DEU56DRAFT_127345 [Suillus clintonianus]KAG2147546.1 hypothetical protein DEU56DRAFT_127345 [Suillus clintonianus]